MVRETDTKEETRPAMMLCDRVIIEEYCVVVEFPKSFSERCAAFRERCASLSEQYAPFRGFFSFISFTLFACALYLSFCWIFMVSHCHQTPGLDLKELTIRDMAAYQNSTTDTTWFVRSDINVNLTTWNPNTGSGCVTTYRRMVVHVDYKGELLLQQEVPLGFKLKPQEKRSVVMELQGDGYAVQQELASLSQGEHRNADVELQVSFDTRFVRNDNKVGWMGMSCDVMVKMPMKSSLQLHSLRSAGGLGWSSCQPS